MIVMWWVYSNKMVELHDGEVGGGTFPGPASHQRTSSYSVGEGDEEVGINTSSGSTSHGGSDEFESTLRPLESTIRPAALTTPRFTSATSTEGTFRSNSKRSTSHHGQAMLQIIGSAPHSSTETSALPRRQGMALTRQGMVLTTGVSNEVNSPTSGGDKRAGKKGGIEHGFRSSQPPAPPRLAGNRATKG